MGDFIREQRSAARVSLRELARTAGVSNPYLSQVERGLRKPSAEILASIARGLKISAEIALRAGRHPRPAFREPGHRGGDPLGQALSERHKAVLLELYETYVREHRRRPRPPPDRTPTRTPTLEGVSMTPTQTVKQYGETAVPSPLAEQPRPRPGRRRRR